MSVLKTFHPSMLRLLRVFHAVATYKGFTAAETVLNIGQPTISSHIKELEDRLGFDLCERGRSGFRLTPAGQSLYESTQRLERELAGFIASVNGIRDELKGSVRIGIPHVISRIPTLTRLHLLIGQVRREFPDIHVEIHLDTQREIEEGIVDGRYDLAVSGVDFRAKNVEVIPLFDMHLRLYCSRGHQLFMVPDEEITREMLLESSAVMQVYDTQRQAPFDVKNALAVPSSEVSLFYVLSGQYLGYLSEHVSRRWEENGHLRAIRPAEYTYSAPGGLIVHGRSADSPAVRKVVELLLEIHAPDAVGNGDMSRLLKSCLNSVATVE